MENDIIILTSEEQEAHSEYPDSYHCAPGYCGPVEE